MNKGVTLSVVIPIYNEENNIDELIARVGNVAKKLEGKNEIICVDDKSKDLSIKKLLNYKDKYPIRIIKLKTHMGQSGALAAGFLNARGEIIAMLDADIQCLPDDLLLLLKHLEPSTGAVCGIRSKRRDNTIKKISSKIGNSFRNLITGDNIKDINCPLKVFRKKAIKSIPFFNGFHRFIPTLIKLNGYEVKQIPVNHYPRKFGRSKYNISNRLFKGFFDVLGVMWLKKNNFIFKDNMEEL